MPVPYILETYCSFCTRSDKLDSRSLSGARKEAEEKGWEIAAQTTACPDCVEMLAKRK